MNHKFLLWLLLAILSLRLDVCVAQTEAKDTISFTTTNVVAEPDPNKGNYIFSLFSPDGEWKVQLNYYADQMFGTFGNDAFRLDGEGKYYNFARNPKNEMVFYSFKEMEVTVTDELTQYRITANCLTSSRTRFLMEGIVEVPQATDTVASELGYALVAENSYYGTYTIEAENEAYRLAYGLAGLQLLGTFYAADMLKPELHDKVADRDIEVISAQAVHTQVGDTTFMTLDLLSSDLVLYHLTMHNAPRQIEVTREEDVLAKGLEIRDVAEVYGCYQMLGESADYYISIAVKEEAIGKPHEDGSVQWSMADLMMPYTFIMRKADGVNLDLERVSAQMAVDAQAGVIVTAEALCADGVLYHIRLEEGKLKIVPKDTVSVDFGTAAVLDYSKGLGIVGLGGIVPDRYQLRIYLNATKLDGDYTTEDCVMDMTDLMVVTGNTYKFHDAMDADVSFKPAADGSILASIDMLGVDTVLYCATLVIPNLKCMQEGKTHDLGNFDMVAVHEGETDGWSEYALQFQHGLEAHDDETRQGDAEVFSFYLAHEGAGLSGEYGYSAGNLADDETHLFYEQGVEVRLGPVAGKLNLKPVDTFVVNAPLYGIHYRANVYDASFQFLGQNGIIYEGAGRQLLLCIDAESGDFYEFTEPELASLNQVLSERGYEVRKVLRGGRVLIERDGAAVGLDGRR